MDAKMEDFDLLLDEDDNILELSASLKEQSFQMKTNLIIQIKSENGENISPSADLDTATGRLEEHLDAASELLQRHSDAEIEISDVETEISGVETEISNAEIETSDAETEMADVETEMANVETEISNAQLDISDAEIETSDAETEISDELSYVERNLKDSLARPTKFSDVFTSNGGVELPCEAMSSEFYEVCSIIMLCY